MQPTHQVVPTEGTATVEGKVQDARTKKPIVGAVVMAKNEDGVVRSKHTTSADGAYQLTLDPRQSYIFTFEAVGYITLDEQFAFSSSTAYLAKRLPTLLHLIGTSPPPASKSTTVAVASSTTRPPATTSVVEQPVVTPPTVASQAAGQSTAASTTVVHTSRVTPPKTLDAKVIYSPPLIVAAPGKTTQLRAIQFVQSKAELLPDAQPALEQLVAFMRDKPTVEIELAGHTDNQGDFDQNVLLSKQRVDVVKEYLVKNGIAASRISTRGYGPTRPIGSNNKEATRQLNRRVELIVVKE
ncbi:hypothetical protein GCM10027190_57570 [Spirosoma areae]